MRALVRIAAALAVSLVVASVYAESAPRRAKDACCEDGLAWFGCCATPSTPGGASLRLDLRLPRRVRPPASLRALIARRSAAPMSPQDAS